MSNRSQHQNKTNQNTGTAVKTHNGTYRGCAVAAAGAGSPGGSSAPSLRATCHWLHFLKPPPYWRNHLQ